MANRCTAYARTATKRDGCQFSSPMEGMPLSKKCIRAPAAINISSLASHKSAISVREIHADGPKLSGPKLFLLTFCWKRLFKKCLIYWPALDDVISRVPDRVLFKKASKNYVISILSAFGGKADMTSCGAEVCS